jgi:hypothetical protein
MRKPNDMLFKQMDLERLLRAHQAMGVSVVITQPLGCSMLRQGSGAAFRPV